MSTDSGSPSDKGENGATPDSAAMQKMIDDAIGRALAARLPRVKNTEEIIATKIAEALAKLPSQQATPGVDNSVETPEKLNLKTLQEQIASERKARLDMERKLQEEQARGVQMRIRSDVESHFARHLGADSKHIKPYVNTYLDQFVHKDGQTYRKSVDDYGSEVLSPVDKGIDEMFKNDLSHLIPARNGGLPPRNQPGQRGTQWTPPTNRAPEGMHPMDAEALDAIAKSRPELAAALAASHANRSK